MAKARKFNIEMTYLHVGGEELEKYASIDDDDDDVETKKEPSPEEVPYMGVPVTPAPCPSSDGFYDEGLPAPEGTSSTNETEMKKADENEHKYLEIVHDIKTNERKSDKVRQVEGLGSPVPCTSSNGFYAERLPASESTSVSEATLNVGYDGYEVPVSHAHHYEDPEERRHTDLNVPGSNAAPPVNPDDSPQSSYELVPVPGTTGDRQVNPAVSPHQAIIERMETTAPLYEEIK